jgi:hypothetical protein
VDVVPKQRPTVSWELQNASGDVLRVESVIDSDTLATVLAAMLSRSLEC